MGAQREGNMIEKQPVRFLRALEQAAQTRTQAPNDWIAERNTRLVGQFTDRAGFILVSDLVERSTRQIELQGVMRLLNKGGLFDFQVA